MKCNPFGKEEEKGLEDIKSIAAENSVCTVRHYAYYDACVWHEYYGMHAVEPLAWNILLRNQLFLT